MIVQPILLIPLLARIAIALRCLGLAAHGLVGGAAIGIILFVGDDLRVIVQFQAGGAKVIGKLVARQLRWRVIIALGAGLH